MAEASDPVFDMLGRGASSDAGSPLPGPSSGPPSDGGNDPVFDMLDPGRAAPGGPPPGPAAPAGPPRLRGEARIPPPAPAAAPDNLSLGAVASGAVRNFLPSAGQKIVQTAQGLMDPVGTIKGLGSLAGGLYSQAGFGDQSAAAKAKNEAAANAWENMNWEHYGTPQNFLRTLKTDPATPLADLAAIATLPAGGEGLVADVPGALGTAARIGTRASRLAQNLDPTVALARVGAKTAGAGAKAVLGAGPVGQAVRRGVASGVGSTVAGLIPIPGMHVAGAMIGEHLVGGSGKAARAAQAADEAAQAARTQAAVDQAAAAARQQAAAEHFPDLGQQGQYAMGQSNVPPGPSSPVPGQPPAVSTALNAARSSPGVMRRIGQAAMRAPIGSLPLFTAGSGSMLAGPAGGAPAPPGGGGGSPGAGGPSASGQPPGPMSARINDPREWFRQTYPGLAVGMTDEQVDAALQTPELAGLFDKQGQSPENVGSPGPGLVRGGGDPSIASDVIRQAEGGFNQPAGFMRSGSSARGAYQMIDSTYVRQFKKAFGSQGMTDDQIKQFRNTPQGWALNETLGHQLTMDETAQLQREGLDASADNLGALHMLGNTRLLHADPSTPIEQVTSAGQRSANAGVFRNIRTAGDYMTWMRHRNQIAQSQMERVPFAGGGEVIDLTGHLMRRAAAAQKDAQAATKPMLGLSDDTIAKALAVAGRSI